jgi:hypothetical protein
METALQAAGRATIADVLPWVTITLDHTDKVCRLIPEDKLDWRPPDPSGRWTFALGELAMHCADCRMLFARLLNNEEDLLKGWWLQAPQNPPGEWKRLREPSGMQEILNSLRSGREALQPWLDRPAGELLAISEGQRASFEARLGKLRAEGKDTAEFERRGPLTINGGLMGAACHEAGHRGTLQTLLRLHGINVSAD